MAIEAHISDIFTQDVKPRNNIIIFSDAKSVLEALGNEDLKNVTIRKLTRNTSNVITAHTIYITLQ